MIVNSKIRKKRLPCLVGEILICSPLCFMLTNCPLLTGCPFPLSPAAASTPLFAPAVSAPLLGNWERRTSPPADNWKFNQLSTSHVNSTFIQWRAKIRKLGTISRSPPHNLKAIGLSPNAHLFQAILKATFVNIYKTNRNIYNEPWDRLLGRWVVADWERTRQMQPTAEEQAYWAGLGRAMEAGVCGILLRSGRNRLLRRRQTIRDASETGKNSLSWIFPAFIQDHLKSVAISA